MMTIYTHQKGLNTKAGAYIEATSTTQSTPLGLRSSLKGRMLQEEPNAGVEGKVYAIAIRWAGQGLSVYQVVSVRDGVTKGSNIWTVEPLLQYIR